MAQSLLYIIPNHGNEIMKRLNVLTKVLTSLLLAGSAFGQNQNIDLKLANLRSMLDRTTAIVRLLPDFPNNTTRTVIEAKLQEAEMNYREAVEHVRNQQIPRARIAIAQAYALLQQIEGLIKQHPVFKIKFQEQLDRKIQQAEEAVRSNQNEEALYMLNRARFFRRQAYFLFRQGRTYQAIEYYRLAMHFCDQVFKLVDAGSGLNRAVSEEEWRNFYWDTQLLLERAKSLQESAPGDGQVKSMLQRAEREIRDVQKLYEKQEYAAAGQKLVAINRMLYRIIDMLDQIPRQESERMRMDLESLEFSLQSVREKMSDPPAPAIQKLYERSESLLNQIRTHIEQDQPLLARRKMFFANQLTLRMYRMLEERPNDQPQEIENQIQAARREMAELQQQSTPGATAEAFFGLMEQNLQNAENAFQKREYLRASYHLLITRRLILKYHRLAGQENRGDGEQETVRRELQRLADLLQRFRADDVKDEETDIRYRNAEQLYQLAEQAFQKREWHTCRELTDLGINLLTK